MSTALYELRQGGEETRAAPISHRGLGHESVETTQIYLAADLAMKEQILARPWPIKNSGDRYQPADRLPAFLQGL
jgi:hypothetical protein